MALPSIEATHAEAQDEEKEEDQEDDGEFNLDDLCDGLVEDYGQEYFEKPKKSLVK